MAAPSPPFALPPLYSFPPFFTLQPTDATRAKQLDAWRSLLIAWHAAQKTSLCAVKEWPYWENRAITRRLSDEGIAAVMEHVVATGSGEWVAGSRTTCRIFYRSPAEWAALVAAWVEASGAEDAIFTLFELRAGDAHVGEGV